MSLRSLFDVDSEQRTAVTHAVAAGFVALATVLLLATTERVFGLGVFAIPFIATAAVVAMAPAAPLARPKAIVLSYPAATIIALVITVALGPSMYTATATVAVSIPVMLLLRAPHAPAAAAAALIGLTDPGVGYLLEPLMPALVVVIATPLLGGRLLPAFRYPASWR
ncbi:MAG TPA: HPP family protein [Jiangellaceae bacterium]|nr:HPP family protein [Jiangellaceae bacterium]